MKISIHKLWNEPLILGYCPQYSLLLLSWNHHCPPRIVRSYWLWGTNRLIYQLFTPSLILLYFKDVYLIMHVHVFISINVVGLLTSENVIKSQLVTFILVNKSYPGVSFSSKIIMSIFFLICLQSQYIRLIFDTYCELLT